MLLLRSWISNYWQSHVSVSVECSNFVSHPQVVQVKWHRQRNFNRCVSIWCASILILILAGRTTTDFSLLSRCFIIHAPINNKLVLQAECGFITNIDVQVLLFSCGSFSCTFILACSHLVWSRVHLSLSVCALVNNSSCRSIHN